MWSLPDIKRLNAEASNQKKALEKGARTGKLDGKKLTCEWHDHDAPSRCEGELRHYLWRDIFSPDPKGIITLCEHHDGYYGSPTEGYFTCSDCGELYAENYTWELYYVNTEDGQVCLPCYAQRVINDEERWIQLTDANIEALSFEQVQKAPHCIGVKMPVPKEIRFVDNAEFDSMDGHSISSSGVAGLRQTLLQLKAEGAPKALLILDAAYQFAVSVGVYVPAESEAA
jgi:hypothetical protein